MAHVFKLRDEHFHFEQDFCFFFFFFLSQCFQSIMKTDDASIKKEKKKEQSR